MGTKGILTQIDAEIRKLEQVRSMLTDTGTGIKIKALATARKKRQLSAEARARIAAAQKARWAMAKKTMSQDKS